MRRKRWGDEGSATVCTVFAAAALCAVFLALMGLGQAVTARHRAGGAADLAALAAADRAVRGPAAACAAAGRVAAAQHTRLVRCAVSGPVADVSVEAGSGPFTTQSRARAGPAAQEPSTARTEAQGPSPARREAQGASSARREAQRAPLPVRSHKRCLLPGPAPQEPSLARMATQEARCRPGWPYGPQRPLVRQRKQAQRPSDGTRTTRLPPASTVARIRAPPPASSRPPREGTDRRTKSVGLAPHPTPTQPAAGATANNNRGGTAKYGGGAASASAGSRYGAAAEYVGGAAGATASSAHGVALDRVEGPLAHRRAPGTAAQPSTWEGPQAQRRVALTGSHSTAWRGR
ncbi:Rv3654c family TadE-like protein [Streptomyces sp. NPDC048197]|uniref:Rv3654c family TadE-like protein n=1 Tax=Streptomyces sp. NPDC048197 TaxID=3365511 RepID=UPI003715C26B